MSNLYYHYRLPLFNSSRNLNEKRLRVQMIKHKLRVQMNIKNMNLKKEVNHLKNYIKNIDEYLINIERDKSDLEQELENCRNKISSTNQEFEQSNKELEYYKEKYKEKEKFCDICWSTIMDEKEIFTCSNEKCKNIYHKSCCEKIRDNKCPFCRVELLKLPEIPQDLNDSEIDMDSVNIEVMNVNEVVLNWN